MTNNQLLKNKTMNLFPLSIQGWREEDIPLLTKEGYPLAMNVVGIEWKGRIVWVAGQMDKLDILGDQATKKPFPIANFTREQVRPFLGAFPKPLFLVPAFSAADLQIIADVFAKSLPCYSINLGEIFAFHLADQIEILKSEVEPIQAGSLESKLLKGKIKALEVKKVQELVIHHFCSQYLSLLPVNIASKRNISIAEQIEAIESQNTIKEATRRAALGDSEALAQMLDQLILTFSAPYMISENNGMNREGRERIEQLCAFCKMWRNKLDLPSYLKYYIQDRIENIEVLTDLIRPVRNIALTSRFLANTQAQLSCINKELIQFQNSANFISEHNLVRAYSELMPLTCIDYQGRRFASYDDMVSQAAKLLDTIWIKIKASNTIGPLSEELFSKYLATQWSITGLNSISTVNGGEDFSSSAALNNVTLRVYHNLLKLQRLIKSEASRIGNNSSHDLFLQSKIIEICKKVLREFDQELGIKISGIMGALKIVNSGRELSDANLIQSDADTVLGFFLRNLNGTPNLSCIEKDLFPLLKEPIQDKSIIEPLIAIANFRDDLLAMRDLKGPPSNQPSADDIIEWIDFTESRPQSVQSNASATSVSPLLDMNSKFTSSSASSASSVSPVSIIASTAAAASQSPIGSPASSYGSESPFLFQSSTSSPALSSRQIPAAIVDVASRLKKQREERKEESQPQRISFFKLKKRDALKLLHDYGFRATGAHDRNNHPIYLHDLTGVTASPAWHSSYDRVTDVVADSLRDSVEESIRRASILKSARENR